MPITSNDDALNTCAMQVYMKMRDDAATLFEEFENQFEFEMLCAIRQRRVSWVVRLRPALISAFPLFILENYVARHGYRVAAATSEYLQVTFKFASTRFLDVGIKAKQAAAAAARASDRQKRPRRDVDAFVDITSDVYADPMLYPSVQGEPDPLSLPLDQGTPSPFYTTAEPNPSHETDTAPTTDAARERKD